MPEMQEQFPAIHGWPYAERRNKSPGIPVL